MPDLGRPGQVRHDPAHLDHLVLSLQRPMLHLAGRQPSQQPGYGISLRLDRPGVLGERRRSVPRGIHWRLQRLQELDQISLLLLGEPQIEMPVVVVDDVPQGREPAVVVVAALGWAQRPLSGVVR